MSGPRHGQQPELLALIDKIDAVPVVEFCYCGRPRSEHTYWDDKVYDVNGYRCPTTTWHQDFRFDAQLTKQRHKEARAEVLANEA